MTWGEDYEGEEAEILTCTRLPSCLVYLRHGKPLATVKYVREWDTHKTVKWIPHL